MQSNQIEFFKDLIKNHSQINGECIEWTGKLQQGYGYVYAFKQTWGMHRVSFLMANGVLPYGLYICHKCNNKKCIKPEHLYAGTAKDNARDLRNSPEHEMRIQKMLKTRKVNIKKREEEFKKHLDTFFSVQEFSEILDVHMNTIYKAIKEGSFIALRVGIGSRSTYRIPIAQLYNIGNQDLNKKINEVLDRREKRSIK